METRTKVVKRPPAPIRNGSNRLATYAGIAMAGLASLLLMVLFGGDLTRPIRDMIGLSYFVADEDGVWADCSKEYNKTNRFCRKDYSSPVRRQNDTTVWRRPNDELPFTLHDGR